MAKGLIGHKIVKVRCQNDADLEEDLTKLWTLGWTVVSVSDSTRDGTHLWLVCHRR